MNDLWYALHVRSRFEKFAQTQLNQKGYETFLPTSVSTRQWSDRVKSVSLPLFPSYLFCRFDLRSRLPILLTPGINAIVGIGKTPMAVDEMEISAIRRVMQSGLTAAPWPYLKQGEMARVVEGSLQGLTGIVVRSKGCDRLVLSVNLLMRSLSVEIDRRCLQPLETFDTEAYREARSRHFAAS